jgi:acyl-CoA thioester hydrolase
VDRDRFTMAYCIVSLTHDEIVAEGSGVVVSFDYRTRQRTDLPESVRQGIDTAEGR